MAKVVLVAGLGYGDEGKGSLIDYLTRRDEAKLVVRYNGGAQAAHNVVTADGQHHLFAQFGSGTLAGARTHLSRHMLVNPLFLDSEEQHLRKLGVGDAFERTTIERSALVTNPFQVASNRLREMSRNKGRHGSCGMGIGETVGDSVALGDQALRVADLESPAVLRDKLHASQVFKREQLRPLFEGLDKTEHVLREWAILDDPHIVDQCVARFTAIAHLVQLVDNDFLAEALAEPGTVLFEGAQGVLLDQDYGTFPYVTRSKITFENAYDLLGDFAGPVTRMGILRTYMTRHGAGPFVTEDPELEHPEIHNCFGPWQEGWRQGHLDFMALDYAVRAIGGVDELAVTHLDCLKGPWKVATGYIPYFDWELPVATEEQARLQELASTSEKLAKLRPSYSSLNNPSPEDVLRWISLVLKAPVTITSHGPTAEDKHARLQPRPHTRHRHSSGLRPDADG